MQEKNKDGKPRQWETLYDTFVVTESTGFKGRLMTGESKRRAAGAVGVGGRAYNNLHLTGKCLQTFAVTERVPFEIIIRIKATLQ